MPTKTVKINGIYRSEPRRGNGPGLPVQLLAVFFVGFCSFGLAQEAATHKPADPVDPGPTQERPFQIPTISEFRPSSNLVVPKTDLKRARFPAVDIHTHFGRRLKGDPEQLKAFVEVMDRHQIAVCTSLDARLGEESEHLDFLWDRYPDRFAVFCHIDFRGSGDPQRPQTWECNQAGFVREVVEKLQLARQRGISGLKFFKQFGLGYRNRDGSLIEIDDPRFDPIWKRCGELGLPVIIHTGDPAAFFQPIDRFNERLEELARHPEWSFYGDDYPSREELLAARNRVVGRHPKTIFIGAHLAGNSEDLGTVAKWLNQMPNLHVELASRISELGRQPHTARRFLIEYQDRVLFGTDGPWPELRLTYYWRFLETADENFPYSEKIPPPQGLWNIYGVRLPDDVLQKIYFKNALRLLPALREKYDRASRALQD